MALQADVGDFLVRLSAGLKGYKCAPEWASGLKTADDQKESANASVSWLSILLY